MTYQGHTVNGKARILRQSEHSWQIDWHFLLFTSARAEPWAPQPSVPTLGVGMGESPSVQSCWEGVVATNS